MQHNLPSSAEPLLPTGAHCWALALGGTRRAYIAQGGTLTTPADLAGYFSWIGAEQCKLLDRVFAMGVHTIITVGRLPSDRGAAYQDYARRAVEAVIDGPGRTAFYAARQVRVSIAGDLDALEDTVGAPGLAAACRAQRAATAEHTGGQIIYLFRSGEDGAEEARWGYQLGQQLGRAPTRDELVRAFYAMDVPPLTVYIGSGRPRIGMLRPPFLSGSEDCYWSANCPLRLSEADWHNLIADHLHARSTVSARGYPGDEESRISIAQAVQALDGQVLGLGYQHALGFWVPQDRRRAPVAKEEIL